MDRFVCDYCNTGLGKTLYSPINSKRGASIYKCSNCSLVQTKYESTPGDSEKKKAISSDADWGNVRHGKGIRYVEAKDYLDPILDMLKPARILDIGSNRGDFIKDALTKDYVQKVVAVEPDISLTPDYDSFSGDSRLECYWKRFEDCALYDNFDFIYSCQTLEHASSARDMLESSFNILDANGMMYVEVPNIEILSDPRGVEEFFIDKHTFHFNAQVLVNIATTCGFSLTQDLGSDRYNIKLLFSKSKPLNNPISSNDDSLVDLISAYPGIIQENRRLLACLVESRLRPLSKRQKVVYWGANRIFDALINYGGLGKDDVFMLVDTYMAGKLDKSSGSPIVHPDYLRAEEPQVCVVLARSSEELIASLAYEMGVRHVLKYSELLDQVANSY